MPCSDCNNCDPCSVPGVSCDCPPFTPVPGPAGPAGSGSVGPAGSAGQSAFTTLSNSFVQPAVGATVVAPVVSSTWLSVGSYVFVQGGGFYSVSALPTTTSATLLNLGGTANASPAAVVPNAAKMVAAGKEGPALLSPLPIASGGTGQATATLAFNALSPVTTNGDMIFRSGGSNTRLAIGAAGQVLTVSGGLLPSWGTLTIAAGSITGTLPINHGGTNATTANGAFANLSPMTTNSDLITRAAGVPSRLGIGSTDQILKVIAGAPVWGSVNINSGSAGISGVLAIANGGTGGNTAPDARAGIGLENFEVTLPGSFGLSLELDELSAARTWSAPDASGIVAVTIVKATTGDPAVPATDGTLLLNTFDETLKISAGGIWRAITITW